MALISVVLALALSACGGAASASPAGAASASPAVAASASPAGSAGGSQATTAAKTILTIIKTDGTSVPVTIDDLKKLTLVSITSDGQPQEGPSLNDVLSAAGATSFAKVTVTGSSGSKTLTKAQVTNDVILDFNNRGSVKLVSPTMSKADRVIDVVTIQLS